MPSTKNGNEKEAKQRILANRYRIVKKLGSGSFGVVHLVEDYKSQDKWKVLKEIPVGDLQPDETVSAVREARLLSTLDHPGIVKFHDSFIDGEHFCIVTEFCEDGDLDDKICEKRKTGKLFDESRVITWLMQLLLAVQYMHQRRILHRDLKTRNIFLKSNMIKIGDFGISRILMGTTDIATTFTGTPYYMSPEVLKHEGYNSKSDIWSLGVILYELCSLRRAFQGQNLMGVMFKIVQNDPPSFPKNFSQQLADIYASILNKDPQKRPSASELLKHPFIMTHMGVLKAKVHSKPSQSKTVEEDSKTIAQFFSASAKKGDITSTRKSQPLKDRSRPMTPGERLKQRKQQKADEEARRLSEITAQSYKETRQKYSETKSKQSHVSASLPWAHEGKTSHNKDEDYDDDDDDDVVISSPVYIHPPSSKEIDETQESNDPLDFTAVSDIPDEEELANTYYTLHEDFEKDEDEDGDSSSSLSVSESDDEYDDLIKRMEDALDLEDQPADSLYFNDLESTEDLSTTSMRNNKIESLRGECIRLLGEDEFKKAYHYLSRIRFGEEESIISEESIMDGLRGLVTKPRDCFLVDQLLFLEKQEEIAKQTH
eukprot:gene18887-20789_t